MMASRNFLELFWRAAISATWIALPGSERARKTRAFSRHLPFLVSINASGR